MDEQKIIVEQLSEDELLRRGIRSWPTWESPVTRFDWYYEEQEQCYFTSGDVVVETPSGPVEIKEGNFVTFPKGLRCVWDVREPVKKHYKFG